MLFVMVGVMPKIEVNASSYSSDYRNWSQGGSDYQGMREVGCLITAQAKCYMRQMLLGNLGLILIVGIIGY